ncbi:uncharacterized protein LOC126900580 [Daktulosphaira vitifoliae]|uniref:uncharacterized protein LOC126900580 n=1 Tax=Daktulosphaira vitifoliae TaxID=58002 RepID=UPI0021AACF89|nr:uncharacterized protein LOC126900580 [Daktulosphaira vitifoliae]
MYGYYAGKILPRNLFIIVSLLIVSSNSQEWLNVTSDYTALMNDLSVELLEPGASVQLYEVKNDNNYTLMGEIPVDENWPSNVTIHCGVITKGGRYALELVSNITISADENTDNNTNDGQIIELDVRWPSATLEFEPKHIYTYPESWQQVMVIIKFEGPQCEPAVGSAVPVLWLDLMYCGLTADTCKNVSKVTYSQNTIEPLVIHSEQIRGYPTFRKIHLKCDVLGIIGFYSAILRPPSQNGRQEIVANVADHGLLEVVQNNKFMLNVHGKSIFPCDSYGGGVPIVFQYPTCILPTADKVRLFGRLRDNVSTLLPPTKLHYISEHRVIKGRHNVYFDCELFSEKYIEYCFVYVNQAINKAYTNIKTQCVPTLPIADDDSGQWSKWSEWSPCSTTCYGGTRNRYRTCDSPPPKYGATFCQGPSLQTEKCGEKALYGHECEKVEQQQIKTYGDNSSLDILPKQDSEELGNECKCGCVIHMSKATRTISATTKGCPGRSLWLIKAEDKTIIQLDIVRIILVCPEQWIKIRDGNSTASNLLIHLEGSPESIKPILSSGSYLLLEFFSKTISSSNDECFGGFFVQISRIENKTSIINTNHVLFKDNILFLISNIDSFLATVSAIFLFLVVTCMCFTVQFAERKHKYHKAKTADKHSIGSTYGMLLDNDHMTSTTSIPSQTLSKFEAISINISQDLIENDIDYIAKSKTEKKTEHSDTCLPVNQPCTFSISQTSLSSHQTMVQSTSSLSKDSRQRSCRLHNTLNSSTDSSIHGHDVSDLEMDYYDYNVHNTNCVPGSYIGMDPAYCLWIPPLSDHSPGSGHEVMEMSVMESKNNKCKRNNEISSKFSNRLSADSESTLIGDDCISLKTLEASPNRKYLKIENQKAEYSINDSNIKFVDEDDNLDIKDFISVNVENKNICNKC